MPRAMSTASEPVEIASIFSPAVSPSFMIEPFPNCFSICWIACSIALDFSVTATSSCSLRSKKERRRLASHRRRLAYFPGGRGCGRAPRVSSPVVFFLALRLHDLEGHRLDGLSRAALFQLLLELFLGLLLLV